MPRGLPMPPLPNRDHSITVENATFKKALKSLRRCTPPANMPLDDSGMVQDGPAVPRTKIHQWPP
jgi:hypothetical protein